MPLYELTKERIRPFLQTTFSESGYRERDDLQRLFREQVGILVPDAYVLDEEFCEWDTSQRRIDLLLVDCEANLVVLELKRTQDGGAMELQALRYAAMVSTMTFEQAVVIHQAYLDKHRKGEDSRQQLLRFLGWDEAIEDAFAQDVRIVLASADFSKELTTSVLWLNQRGIDIRCVRIRPYADGDRVLLDVQQVIPIPEAEEYQVKVQHKTLQERSARGVAWDEPRLISAIRDKHGQVAADVATQLLRGIESLGLELSWGTAKDDGKVFASVNRGGKSYFLARVAKNRGVVLPLAKLQSLSPELRRVLADSWTAATGVSIDAESLNGFPAVPLLSIAEEDRLESLLEHLRFAVQLIDEAATASSNA
jgi:hypothetical protein